jgi:hypothetical protein
MLPNEIDAIKKSVLETSAHPFILPSLSLVRRYTVPLNVFKRCYTPEK